MEEMEEMDPEIAAAMGFSSFGQKQSSKKRKFDNADEPSTTGSNSIELGVRPKKATEDSSTNPGLDQGKEMDTVNAQGHPTTARQREYDATAEPEARVQSVDAQAATSKKKQKSAAPTGLAQFLARAKTLPDRPAITVNSDNPVASSGATIPATAMTSVSQPSNSDLQSEATGPDLQALRKGVRNGQGDMAYFLPSFIEDPWSNLPNLAR